MGRFYHLLISYAPCDHSIIRRRIARNILLLFLFPRGETGKLSEHEALLRVKGMKLYKR